MTDIGAVAGALVASWWRLRLWKTERDDGSQIEADKCFYIMLLVTKVEKSIITPKCCQRNHSQLSTQHQGIISVTGICSNASQNPNG